MMRSLFYAALATLFLCLPASAQTTTFYVSPQGSDSWSGTLAAPNAGKSDGPFATLNRARDAVRALKARGPLARPVKVLVRGGTYPITEPLAFGPEDSGTKECPITYAAYPGERQVISGGRVIRGFKKGADGRWSVRIPEARDRRWPFRQLFINGKRATLARSPNQGYYYVAGKAAPVRDPKTGAEVDRAKTAFRFQAGDLKAWSNPQDISIYVYHIWETSIHPVAAIDEAAGTVTLTGPAKWAFTSQDRNQRYVVENHPGALDAPGEWQLDRQSGILTVIPPKGVDMARAEVVAPIAPQFLVLQGEPELGLHVEHLRFEGLSFQHAEWKLPAEGHSDWQAAVTINAAIQARGARNVSVERCEVAHIGNYAIWFERGCHDNRVVQCHLHDLGAGGVRIGEGGRREGAEATGRNVVENNFIHSAGHIHAGAHGVWVGQSSDNVIAHNEICDINYTGISVGWSWGFQPTTCHRNRVEYNYIHHVGQQVLSDMGGIYTLGISTGTVIRNNLIHDCWGYERSGSGGIYPDEGSTGILIENNVVYHTQNGGLSIHYARDLTVRNNIFALSRDRQVSRGRIDKDTNFVFERNIVYYDRGVLYRGTGRVAPDKNIYFHAGGEPVLFPEDLSLKEWQAKGMDANSLIADPLFVDPKRFDFRLKPESPALRLGFVPIDTSKCGLTGPKEWVHLPRYIKRPKTVMPVRPEAKPLLVSDDFEATPIGTTADYANTLGEAGKAAIRITGETALSGGRSLKFTDAPGLDQRWNPHLYWTPNLAEGTARLTLGLRVEKGSAVWMEWRDASQPFRIGPSLNTDAEGRLLVGGKPVAQLPLGQWVRLEMTCGLGSKAAGSWDLTVTAPGQAPLRLEKLACDPKFKKLEWLGIISNATDTATFFVDNVKLEIAK